jgi:2-polyprenyl-3-methyl-5-hydroxy-6-metoxy-1,4-benzoquinol methylase
MTSEPTPDDSALALQSAVERTRRSYDETPYRSAPLMRAHPARMAANARFLGLNPPQVAQARILEIGCASGGHLIPLAAQFPQARFLGVDLSPVQIAAGQARIARLALDNITLAARSLADLGAADGRFDYIVCHGVYSWIPETLRDELFRVCKERLSADGVAMISYNVLPGWRLFQIARDCMQLHASALTTHQNRSEQTRRMFELLGHYSNEQTSYGHFWRHEAKKMTKGDDAYLAHELFEDSNAPCTFADFTARAGRHGLAYLCETWLAANNPDSLAGEAAPAIEELSTGDPLAREQYLDIFSGRSFRESLLIHAERSASVDRSTAAARIDGLDLIAPMNLEARPSEEKPGEWIIADGGGGVVCDDSEIVAAIQRLIARRPKSSRLDDLASGEETTPERRVAIAAVLRRMLLFGHLDIASEPVDCPIALSIRPKAWRLAASDARESALTASLRHSPFELSPLQRFLLMALDGTRTRDDLVALVVEEGLRGNLRAAGPDGPIEGRENLTAYLAPTVDECLSDLLRAGLLES